MVGGLAGVAVAIGAINLTGSVDVTARFLGMSLAAGAVGLVVKGVLWPALKRDAARSFTPRRFTSRFMGLGLLAWLGGVAVLVPIALIPTGPTLMALPGWVLLVAGALTFFIWVRNLGGDRVVDPRG